MQGVGFRWFVRQQAESLGLAGWIRNTNDGAVEVAAQGEAHAIEKLVSVAGQGPPGSVVTSVAHLVPPAGAEYPNPFRILT